MFVVKLNPLKHFTATIWQAPAGSKIDALFKQLTKDDRPFTCCYSFPHNTNKEQMLLYRTINSPVIKQLMKMKKQVRHGVCFGVGNARAGLQGTVASSVASCEYIGWTGLLHVKVTRAWAHLRESASPLNAHKWRNFARTNIRGGFG